MTEQAIFLLFVVVAIFLSFGYAGFVLWLLVVLKLQKRIVAKSSFEPSVSFIIAFRNEENNLTRLLDSLLYQNYPQQKLEILLVDDSSDDKGKEIVEAFQKKYPEFRLRLLELNIEKPGAFGKKAALNLAIRSAKNDFVLLTDADCFFDKKNIQSRIGLFENKNIKMVLAPVFLENTNTIFSAAQALENLSLMATTAASTAAFLPIMSNGANLAFERMAYFSLPNNAMQPEFASGDDLFLLNSFTKQFGAKSIAFSFDKSAAVFTQAQGDLKHFLYQRIRWVSKSKHYTNFWLIFISLLILSFNFSIVLAAFGSVFNVNYLIVFGYLFVLKLVIDFPFLNAFATLYHQRQSLKVFPLLQLIYPFFIVMVGFLGHFLPYKWKGRKY